MSMGIKETVIASLIASAVVAVSSKLLDVGGQFLPEDLSWLSWLGAMIWETLIKTVPVPWVLLYAAIAYWFIERIGQKDVVADLRAQVESLEATLNEDESEQEGLSVEELEVMHALALYDGPMDMDDLLHHTALSRLRLSHVVDRKL